MKSGKPLTLAGHVLLRVLPVALLLLTAFGALFIHRENRTMEARVSERLQRDADRAEEFFSRKIKSFQAQVRMTSQNDLVANSIVDFDERRRYMPFYFRSLGAVGGTEAVARFSLLDFMGREIICNGLPCPGLMDSVAHVFHIEEGSEVMLFDGTGLMFSSPVLLHGFAEGMVSVSLGPEDVNLYFAGLAQPGYLVNVFDSTGHLVLVAPDNTQEKQTLETNGTRGWATEIRNVDIDGFGEFRIVLGIPFEVAYDGLVSIRRQMLVFLSFALLTILGTIVFATRYTALPVTRLADDFLKVARKRDLGGRVPVSGPLELQKLSTSFNKTMSELEDSFSSRNRLDELLAGSPAVIYTAPPGDLRLTFISANITDLLGFGREEIMNSFDWRRAYMHPGDRDQFVDKISHWAAAGAAGQVAFAYRMKRFEGRWVWIEDRLQGITGPDGTVSELIGALSDITERKNAEEALKLSREQFELAVQGSNDGIWVWDLRDDSVYLSAKWKEQLGYAYDELENSIGTFHKLLHPEDKPEVLDSVQRYLKGDSDHYCMEFRMIHKDGSSRWILARGKAFRDSHGIPLRMAGSHTDITERKVARDELVRTNDLLQAKNKELEQVVYVVSHDLRSPLVNIDGYSREIEYLLGNLENRLNHVDGRSETGGTVDPRGFREMADSLRYIRKSAGQMDRLLSGLLKLSRLSRESLSPRNLDMGALLNDIFDSQGYYRKAGNISIDIGDLPPCFGDPNQMTHLFSNLIGNAAKYLDRSRPGEIRLTGYRERGRSVYCVEDNGIGIEKEHFDKIFEIFYRLEPQKFEGDGLGLAIVRQVLQMMGGKVWLESEPGRGSRFYVSMPGDKWATFTEVES